MALFAKKKDSPNIPDFSQQPQWNDPYPQQYPPTQDFSQDPGLQDPNAQPAVPPPQPDIQQGYDQGYQPDDTRERVEEIAEAIIDEKWNELMREIGKVLEWKERTDTELKRIAQEILNLKERFESLHKGVLGKISEYDSNLTNVGTEIKAMEMAFQKILPTFTENVNKLERIIKGPKKI